MSYEPLRKVRIHTRFKNLALAHMKEDNEQVFILKGRRTQNSVRVDNFIEVPNRHEDPKNFFRLDLYDVAPRHVRELVGIMHTHPEGQPKAPSSRDIEQMSLAPAMLGIVVHTPSRIVTLYDFNGIIAKTTWR